MVLCDFIEIIKKEKSIGCIVVYVSVIYNKHCSTTTVTAGLRISTRICFV
jgi:hypothetical protein